LQAEEGTTSKGEESRGKKYNIESKKVYLGTDNFDDIIEKQTAVVDKTMFIKEWMEKFVKKVSIPVLSVAN
jgi:hypothetical protein